jgi:hypothetical protein
MLIYASSRLNANVRHLQILISQNDNPKINNPNKLIPKDKHQRFVALKIRVALQKQIETNSIRP